MNFLFIVMVIGFGGVGLIKINMNPGKVKKIKGNKVDAVLSIPIEMEAYINSIAPTASEAHIKINKACSVNWAVTTDSTATINDIDSASIKGTSVLLANTITNISISGLTANTTYYLHRYYTGTQPQNPLFLRTTATLTQTGRCIIDPSDSSLVTIDGSNRISKVQSRINNHKFVQYTDLLKPTYSSNQINSDVINDLLQLIPGVVIKNNFTICAVANHNANNYYLCSFQNTQFAHYVQAGLQGAYIFRLFNKNDSTTVNNLQQVFMGEHRFIITANGTLVRTYLDGVLIVERNVSVASNLYNEINRLLGTTIFVSSKVRFAKILNEYTADIATLDTELQNYLSGNDAPVASNITLDKASVQQGTPVTIETTYTYTDTESDLENTSLRKYAWETSADGVTNWIRQSIVTQSYTPSVGEVGRYIRGGVVVFAQTGNYSTGVFVFSNAIEITA
jgi:hypothetical protein